jgi:hypothetical protein
MKRTHVMIGLASLVGAPSIRSRRRLTSIPTSTGRGSWSNRAQDASSTFSDRQPSVGGDECRLLALTGHAIHAGGCPLLGAKQTLTNRCFSISVYEYTALAGETVHVDCQSGTRPGAPQRQSESTSRKRGQNSRYTCLGPSLLDGFH